MTAIADFDLAAIGPDFIADPYPTLHALREARPVHRMADGSVLLTRHADCLQVYRSRRMLSDKRAAFGARFGDGPLFRHHTTSLVFNDPPYHTTIRRLMAAAFTPRRLREMERLVDGIVDRLLDGLAERGRADVVADFATGLPTEVIAFMLGVPSEHRAQLRSYSLAILGALDPVVPPERLERGNRAVDEFGAVLREVVARRRADPDGAGPGEVLDALVFGEEDGRRLTDDELVENAIFLLNAGHETTTSLVGNAVGLLLDHPEVHRRLLDDPALVEPFLEECLRLESPLQIGNRLAGEAVTLAGGERLERGTYIHTSIAAANRDGAAFPDPDRIRLDRGAPKHLAFITGIHVCLGATLARIEGRIAVGRLVRRFPGLRADGPRARVPLARFRGWATLPVAVG